MTGTELTHRVEHLSGARIHCVEAGAGPLVLFVHGFPESWYSWRHQLPAVAAAGFRAVAIDVRGYGRSSKPVAIDEYRMLKHVQDNVELVEALGETSAVIVGHDWGAPIAWNTAMLRPDVFRAVAGLSVPYSPPSTPRPTDVFRMLGGAEEFYIEYFQQPGRAEAEIEENVKRWLLGFYFSASGDAPPMIPGGGTIASVAVGGKMHDRFRYPDPMPSWLTDDDLAFYAAEFEHSGFAGPLNRYRNVDRDWSDLAAFRGRPITVPSLFIGGEKDGPTIWGAASIAKFTETLPALTKSVVLPGCGHWVQQERASETNELLVEFLRGLG